MSLHAIWKNIRIYDVLEAIERNKKLLNPKYTREIYFEVSWERYDSTDPNPCIYIATKYTKEPPQKVIDKLDKEFIDIMWVESEPEEDSFWSIEL